MCVYTSIQVSIQKTAIIVKKQLIYLYKHKHMIWCVRVHIIYIYIYKSFTAYWHGWFKAACTDKPISRKSKDSTDIGLSGGQRQ